MRHPTDPLPGARNTGAAAIPRPVGQRWELGTVVEYNPATHTSTVRTNRGRPLENVPQLKQSPGAFEQLATGVSVVVSWDVGFPIIIGVIDDVGLPQTAIPSMSLTGVEGVGSTDPTQPTNGTNNYRPPFAPSDLGPNDFARVGRLGNHVAVLEGGVTLVGSPTAQVRSIGPTGTMQTIARRLEQITDWGHVRVENDQGKTSFVLRAGSNQTTETGLDEQHWTIRLDLGATGDMFDFQILEPDGKALFRMHVGSDGRVQLYGDGGVDLSSGAAGSADVRSDHAGPRALAIGGDDTVTVTGNRALTVEQSMTEVAAGDVTRSAGGTWTEFSAGNRAVATGGDATDVVAGARSTRVGEDDATEVDGEWSVLARKDVTITSKTSVLVKGGTKARVDANKVVLGTNGTHPLPKFDVFLRDFGSFLGDLQTALANAVPLNPFAVPGYMLKIALFAAKVGVGVPYKSLKVSND